MNRPRKRTKLGEMPLFSEDRSFVRRLLAGDERAYDELFDVHAQKMYRFALARVGDPSLAEELVQASLTKALPKLAEYRGEASLLTWLCAFCRFEILSQRKKQRRRQAYEAELPDDVPEVETALELVGVTPPGRPEDDLLQKEQAYLIRALLDRLPGQYGDVLEWKYQEGLSVADIAERLRLTTTAAQSMLARARRAFRDGFAEIEAASREAVLKSP